MKRYVLFDLDGTLTEPKEGIVNSVIHSLRYYPHIAVPSRERLCDFIGPPLALSYMRYFGMDEKTALQAVEHYREYFAEKGIFENTLYPGVEHMLEVLVESGHKCVLATSKPWVFAERILDHFGISKYFEGVVGSELDGSRVEKQDVIAAVMDRFPQITASEAVMVGDRRFDAEGARANGIRCIGVTYGHGSGVELARAGCYMLVGSTVALERVLAAL